jgi:hypothetical protein
MKWERANRERRNYAACAPRATRTELSITTDKDKTTAIYHRGHRGKQRRMKVPLWQFSVSSVPSVVKLQFRPALEVPYLAYKP